MVAFYRYHLPFHKPFATAAGTFNDRSGVLIHLENDRFSGLAEASPLPGFSGESTIDAETSLIAQKEVIEAFSAPSFRLQDLKKTLTSLSAPPSVRFAVSSLGAFLLLNTGRAALGDLFSQPFRHEIKVNAVTGAGSRDEMISSVIAHHARGFRTVKMKTTPDPALLAFVLKEMKKKFPDMAFRIDANRSWPAADALAIIALFKGLNVEYIEEPVHAESVTDYHGLIQESPIPIALDESLTGVESLEAALDTFPEAILIIKPTLLGSIFSISETISAKKGPKHRVIVTTALESAVGRSVIQSMAAITGDLEAAHGLDTGKLFRKDLLSIPEAKNGVLLLQAPFVPCKLSDIDQNLIQKID